MFFDETRRLQAKGVPSGESSWTGKGVAVERAGGTGGRCGGGKGPSKHCKLEVVDAKGETGSVGKGRVKQTLFGKGAKTVQWNGTWGAKGGDMTNSAHVCGIRFCNRWSRPQDVRKGEIKMKSILGESVGRRFFFCKKRKREYEQLHSLLND